MKRTLAISLVIALAIIAVGRPITAHAEPAVVIKDSGCVLGDENGNFVFTPASQIVITNSANGNSKITCKADVVNTTGRSVHLDFNNTGIFCSTTAGITSSWHEVISASGQATLQCEINPGNP